MTQADTFVRPAKPPAHMLRSLKAVLGSQPCKQGVTCIPETPQGGLAQLKVMGRQGGSCLIAQAAV